MPSSGLIRMQVAGRTDVGLVREHNEDNFTIVDLGSAEAAAAGGNPPAHDDRREIALRDNGALLIVCDGMGGAAAGEVASSMAIETVASAMRAPSVPPADGVDARTAFARRLREAAFAANRRIHQASLHDDARAGMGTTMTSVGVVGEHLVMAQVGDSRAYVLRGSVLTQVTRDQSLVNQLVETGQITEEQARMFEHSNVILQALGVQEEVEVLLSTVPLRRGDRLVLCTDGLTGVVSDEEMAAILATGDEMNESCGRLVEMARAAGGPDNITVVTARFEGEGLPLPDGEAVSYVRWRLDEAEPTPTSPNAPPTLRWERPPVDPAQRPPDPAKTFLSLMVLLALALAGLVAASQIRRAGSVRCAIEADPGLEVRVDGRDTGLRTRRGDTEIRLPAGRHRVGLRGRGAPSEERAIEVANGGACTVSFDGTR